MIFRSLLLAVTWTALQGEPTMANFLGGWVLGWAVLAFTRLGDDEALRSRWRLRGMVALARHVVRDLLLSNIRVSIEALRREPLLDRAILEVPLEPDTAVEIATLANLIGLTPGTLSLHISRDRNYFYVHSLFASEERESSIRQGFKKLEAHVREAVQ